MGSLNSTIDPTVKKARADLEATRRIFTIPAGPDSTLGQIEAQINENLLGFLRDHITAGDLDPETIERDFSSTKIPENPVFVSEQTTYLMEKVVAQAVHVSNPSFVGHMTSAVPHFMLTLAKIMTALNQNLVKIETSKSFTPLERQVIAMLHRLVYDRDDQFYKDQTHAAGSALGSFCSGGTVANLTCLWLARNLLLAPVGDFQGVAEDGLAAGLAAHNLKDLNILVSTRGHYSLHKSADVLGLGRKQVIAIPTTKTFKVDCGALEKKLKALKADNHGILAVIGVAGTTETGHIDPLVELADICAEHQCHYHVDAAWGGPTLFSNKYRHLLAGIERADSVIIDAHKQLYVPVGAGIALFKDPLAARAIEHHASYIIRRGSRDLGKFTLEGSRAGLAMLVHSGLRIIARSGYELLIDLGIGKAAGFAKTLNHCRDFEVISPPETNLLTYRYLPESAVKILQQGSEQQIKQCNEILNELTIHIQKRQRSAGKTFVSRTTIEAPQYQGQALTVFRVVLANPLTTRQILASVLEEQREHAAVCVTFDGIADRLNELATG